MNDNLKELTEAERKVANECANMRKKCQDKENEFAENQQKLADLNSQNQSLKNSIEDINLDELESRKMENEQNYENILNDIKNDLSNATDALRSVEELNNTTAKALESEIKITNELEAYDAKLEDELVGLLSAYKELNETNDEIDRNASSLSNSLNAKIHELNCNLAKLNQDIQETVEKRKNKAENLNIMQQKNKELQEKLSNLQHQTEKLTNETKRDLEKLAELEQQELSSQAELRNTESLLADAKQKFLNTEKAYSAQLEEAENELSCAQINLQKAKEERDTKIKTLKDDLDVYRVDTENTNQQNQEKNQEMLQKQEQQLIKVKQDLDNEKKNLEQIRTIVNQKMVTRNRLQIDLDLLKISQQSSREPESVLETVRPQGILKPAGKSVPSKNVSWRVPSHSSCNSGESNSSQQSDTKWQNKEELFNELLETSPPVRLEESKTRKRSRLI